jgi:hypothetical protein
MSKKPAEPQKATPASRLAGCYFRLFNTADGRKVLADLRRKFGEERPRFVRGGSTALQDAALTDGECNVMREIRLAIEAGKNAPEESP